MELTLTLINILIRKIMYELKIVQKKYKNKKVPGLNKKDKKYLLENAH